MPPKPKFTREEIIEAAVSLLDREGVYALTTRNIGKELGSSARPIFTVFKNMEDLNGDLRQAVMKKYNDCVIKAQGYTPAFKKYGMQMVLFATEKPNLYRYLFMRENKNAHSFDDLFDNLGETAGFCIDVIERDYELTDEKARVLFENVWIYTFGIATLCATGACRFSEEELSNMLGSSFKAAMMLVKSNAFYVPTPFPLVMRAAEKK